MCLEAVPRFGMSIRETFSNSISLPVTNEYDKGAVMKISTVLSTFTTLLVEASSEMGLFRHLSDYVFGVRNLVRDSERDNLRIPIQIQLSEKIFFSTF